MTWIAQNLWLIPALPLLAAGLSALANQRQRTLAASLAIGSMGVAFLLSCLAFITTIGHQEPFREFHNFSWFQLGETTLQLGWVLDPLTAVMLVMVTFVGLLIFIYSIGYMAHDENYTRFFCFLSLFAAAMLGLVIANSLLLLFVSWELVGLASYLLIGFWYHKPSAAAAAKKAFIVTRIGDIGFFLGILWLYSEAGTLLFYDSGNGCLEHSALTKLIAQTTTLGMAVSTGIALLIFCGAIGKSGQVPLHVWLPDAMEGPTPVSALIHAATMVAAGVFLVARVYPLMEAMPAGANLQLAINNSQFSIPSSEQTVSPRSPLAPSLSPSGGEGVRRTGEGEVQRLKARTSVSANPLPGAADEVSVKDRNSLGRGEGERLSASHSPGTSAALEVVTWVGAITAMFAALIAVAQTDIKRILAYSTVSQLGYMMMGLGVGGVAVGMFHLITHAFFKALLFLGSGSVIHGCHEEQDIRKMGGLRKLMPVTFATYAVGMLALAGVPLFSGFWSKDEILHAAYGWPVSKLPFLLGLFGALLTAFYMTRQVCYVFFGDFRSESDHARSPSIAPGDHGSSHASLAVGQAADEAVRGPHESPRVMTVPLVILAVFALLLGFVGTPLWPWFQTYLTGHHESVTWWGVLLLMLVSTCVVLAGIGIAALIYGLVPPESQEEKDVLERWQPSIFAILRDKFYVDELYEATIIRLNARFSRFVDWLDAMVLGALVTAVSYLVLGMSWVSRVIDEYVINLGFNKGCERLRLGGGFFSKLQNGQVQDYLRVIALALTVFLLFLTWGCSQ
jgi:NADH:ubiquinone oxidoreductase subunit 5 (subunit L)/multisubunit Na+/H+ antiporter MnhA subunit